MWQKYGPGRRVLLAANVAALAVSFSTVADEWPWYGHDPGGTRYSPLTQINRENVSTLKVAPFLKRFSARNLGSGVDVSVDSFP